MNQNDNFSDEFLNSYIDAELGEQDRNRLLQALRDDEQLSLRLSRLQKIRAMVQEAYPHDMSIPASSILSKSWQRPWLAVAASGLLLFGIVTGWLVHQQVTPDNQTLVQHDNPQSSPASDNVWRVVMHVDTTDTYLQNTLLDETEYLLKSSKDTGKKVQIEIVAYGAGLTLFDSDTSAYAERITSLQKQYTNLSLAACGRTIKRMTQDMHKDIRLLPNVTVANSGIRQIVKRQQEGWHYIRI